jgi:hypothetical protein
MSWIFERIPIQRPGAFWFYLFLGILIWLMLAFEHWIITKNKGKD